MVGVVGSSPIAPTKHRNNAEKLPATSRLFFCLFFKAQFGVACCKVARVFAGVNGCRLGLSCAVIARFGPIRFPPDQKETPCKKAKPMSAAPRPMWFG